MVKSLCVIELERQLELVKLQVENLIAENAVLRAMARERERS